MCHLARHKLMTHLILLLLIDEKEIKVSDNRVSLHIFVSEFI